MQPATLVALAATVVNMLQGWDTGAIGGALLFIKPELRLNPSMEGLVVAASLGGAWLSTLTAGASADKYGRRKILRISAVIFLTSSCIMAWTPNIYVLLFARLILGAAVGLITTIAPMYIAEIAPTENRGQLLTFPQLMGSMGQFFSYVLVFIMSLSYRPVWRYMLGMLFVPAVVNLGLCVFYIPESPRWLVSKGRMVEAKKVLQKLRNTTDVTAELALLVEGLNTGETVLEEWLLKPDADTASVKYGSFRRTEGNVSWIGTSVADGRGGSFISRRASMVSALRDPVVTLFGSMHSTYDHLPSASGVFGTFRGTHDHLPDAHPELYDDKTQDHWDHEEGPKTPQGNGGGYQSDDGMVGNLDENLSTPLLSHARSGKFDGSPWAIAGTPRGGGGDGTHRSSIAHGSFGDQFGSRVYLPRPSKELPRDSSRYSIAASVPESIASVGIGGGWQLAWQWTGGEGQEGGAQDQEGGQFKRVFLLQQPGGGPDPQGFSAMSLPGVETESIQAAALVGQPAQYSKEIADEHPVGPAMVHPAETAVDGVAWTDLLEVGVRRALIVGMLLQILQQFSGINAVQSFIPQILAQSGASELLTSLGINKNSASILASTFSSLLTLPCVIFAMKIMDRAGRRQLLIVTLPILFVALITIAVSNLFLSQGFLQSSGSFGGVLVYICTFVMGFGAIPNIICSEIFPTRVRGICIGLCQTAFWTCNILITNIFPSLLQAIGIGGIFGLFSIVVFASWIFVYLKVPETKGMPLEVISEFFAMAPAKQTS